MKSATLVAALAAVVPAAFGLTVDTPQGVVACRPVLMTWSGGTPPYNLALRSPEQAGMPTIREFPRQSGTSYTWDVDLAIGTLFSVFVRDDTGASAYSDVVTVQAGIDNSCVSP